MPDDPQAPNAALGMRALGTQESSPACPIPRGLLQILARLLLGLVHFALRVRIRLQFMNRFAETH